MKKILDFWPKGVIFLLVGLFFYRLFFPPSIFVTPDFGLSDTLNQNFAFRVALHDSLRQGTFPGWNEKMGMGFPLLAEGQAGALNLFNLVLAYLFPPWLSFNLTYVVVFLMIGVFTYLFAREIGLGKFTALFSSVVLMFSGPLMGHLIHVNLLLAFAYFPLALWLIEKILVAARSYRANGVGRHKMPQLHWYLLLALVINQQILAGHLQMAVCSILVLVFYVLFRIVVQFVDFSVQNNPNYPEFARIEYFAKRGLITTFLPFLFSLGLAVLLSLPQLLPSFELARESGRSGNLPVEELTRFPFLPKNLFGFLNPNWLGNPKEGGYGKGDQEWGLWWENQGYIGLIPLILAMISIGYLTIKLLQFLNAQTSKLHAKGRAGKTQNARLQLKTQSLESQSPTSLTIFFSLLTLIGVVLALGVNGPLGFLYSFPPLTLFRVPARWLFFVVFALAMLAGFGISLIRHIQPIKVLPRTALYLGILLFSLFNLWFYFYNHNPIGKIEDWLSPPATVEFIKNYNPNYKDYRVYDLGTTVLWDKYFWEEGWGGKKLERFKDLREGLTPNMAAIWGLESADVYAGVKSLNLVKAQYLLSQHQVFEPDPESVYKVSFDAVGVRILSSQNIRYIITPLKINQNKETFLVNIYEKKLSEFTIRVYENLRVWPRFYFVENIQENFTLPILDSDFIIETSESQAGKVALEVENPEDSFLVWSQSFYPGWKVEVGGVEKEIYQYNINQMALFLKKGEHRVEFKYE